MNGQTKSVKYISPEDLVQIVDVIQNLDYPHQEEVPKYDDQPEQIDEYFSLVDRARNDSYYPDLYSKATFLFLNLNSHYFANGNKRLATFSLLFFLENNGCVSIGLDKRQNEQIITKHFGDHELEDYENFSAKDFLMYNVAVITARFNKDGVNFETAKEQVENFLREVFVPN